MVMIEMMEWTASIIVGFIALILILRGFCLIRANQVGILTKKMFGKKMPEGQIIARQGEIGVQARTLMDQIVVDHLNSGKDLRSTKLWKQLRPDHFTIRFHYQI